MTVLAERPKVAVVPRVFPAVEDPLPYTAEEFKRLALLYPDLRMEMSQEGEVTIMPPVFTGTGRRNIKLATRLTVWAEQQNNGETFDSSTGFTLPSGAKRSPDVSWIERSRWERLSKNQQENEFAPICPDFVIELRSKTDRLSTLQAKMQEYAENGAKLGWLIDSVSRRVEVYRPGREPEILENPASVSGEPELPGFTLDLTGILDSAPPAAGTIQT